MNHIWLKKSFLIRDLSVYLKSKIDECKSLIEINAIKNGTSTTSDLEKNKNNILLENLNFDKKLATLNDDYEKVQYFSKLFDDIKSTNRVIGMFESKPNYPNDSDNIEVKNEIYSGLNSFIINNNSYFPFYSKGDLKPIFNQFVQILINYYSEIALIKLDYTRKNDELYKNLIENLFVCHINNIYSGKTTIKASGFNYNHLKAYILSKKLIKHETNSTNININNSNDINNTNEDNIRKKENALFNFYEDLENSINKLTSSSSNEMIVSNNKKEKIESKELIIEISEIVNSKLASKLLTETDDNMNVVNLVIINNKYGNSLKELLLDSNLHKI